MRATNADEIVLLLHDGELADVATQLSDLQLSTRECRGKPTREDRQKPWELVIGTPARLQQMGSGAPGRRSARIAVVDKESRTLRTMLNRIGVDYTVRRPVHATTLRLLLIHTVYRGPERRRTRRVHIGAPIRFRAGLRRHDAILADLSMTGCRLLAPTSLSHGRRIRIQVPDGSDQNRTFSVSGRVIRSAPAPDESSETQMIAVHFDRPSRRTTRKVSSAVECYGRGPATYALGEAPTEAPSTEATERPTAARVPIDREPCAAAPKPNGGECADRRRENRHGIDRRIIALGEEATKVLMGRDISLGGMRVDPAQGLSVGDRLQLALHVRAREAPLVIWAEVARDEGADGLALAFRDLDESSRTYLENMVKFLPILASREGSGEGVIMSEVLERESE